jgi:hypothetical protein
MSLFKARDWWSTWAGSEEDFDQGCLCVANIDNESSPSGIKWNKRHWFCTACI